ncbi:MAG TPA: AI-2E family transporter [Alphaproteobacteria bacterium]|nr:AI-2E family transporter [Alphaproteobacteria bacterium]
MTDRSEEASRASALEFGQGPLPDSKPLVTVGVLAAVVAALYFLREVFIPIALAVLLSFMLGPAVTRLRRWGIGRITATLSVVTIAGVVIAGIATVVAFQIVDLADNITQYQSNLVSKIRTFKDAPGEEGLVERTSEMIENLSEELEEAATPADPEEEPSQPIAVEVHTPKPSPLQMIARVMAPLLGPVATSGVVVVFVIFILLYREDLRDRIIRLVSSGDLQRTTEAMSEAGQRVSRYLLMQLVVNATYGVPVGIGLFIIGVPNPALWGLLATLLRFIPYAGPVIAAAFPILLSFAIDTGWTTPLLTIGLFLGIELISNNIIEPWLYGSSTGISSIAIIVAAVFWTWLWGPIGLLLSTPLTVCLVVIGQYVPQLRFLDVMLGNAPVLPPHSRFYQRLLAQDPDEAAEIAEEFIASRSVEALYDELILPALMLAERDRQRGSLTFDRMKTVADATRSIIEDYADWQPSADQSEENGARPSVASDQGPPQTRPAALCVGAARSLLDELAAAMLAQLLIRRGCSAVQAAAATLDGNELPIVSGTTLRIVAICSLHPSAILQIRRTVRRLRPKVTGARMLACVLNGRLVSPPGEKAVGTTADFTAMSLVEAVEQIEQFSTEAAVEGSQEVSKPAAPTSESQDGSSQAHEIDDPHVRLCHAVWPGARSGGDIIETRRCQDGTLVGILATIGVDQNAAGPLAAALGNSFADHSPTAEDPVLLLNLLERDLEMLPSEGVPITAIAFFYRSPRRALCVASAGNPGPILLRGDAAEPLPVPAGPQLLLPHSNGADAPRRKAAEFLLDVEDRVLFSSQGAIEVANSERGFLEATGLAELAREHRGLTGASFLEHLIAAIRDFGEGEPEDDVMLLSLEVRDPPIESKLQDAAD